jgi:hypothetical protein
MGGVLWWQGWKKQRGPVDQIVVLLADEDFGKID